MRDILVAILATVVATQVLQVDSARILGIFSPPSPSHYILGHKLMKELSLKGHEVTLISSFGKKEPMKNYKDIVLTGFHEKMEEMKKDMLNSDEKPILTQFSTFIQMSYMMAEETFKATDVQKLIASDQKFDLVIMEAFLNDAHVGFAHHFDAPLIIVSTVGSNIWVNHYAQNPSPTAYVAQMASGKVGKMTFVERLKNTLLTGLMEAMFGIFHYPQQNKLMHEYFPDAPHMNDIIRERTALILLNSHSSFSQAKPAVPSMIEIGGFHVEEPKELPKDLKEYLDNAKEGFILFSMGSNIKGTMLPEETRNIFMKAFEKLPYKILWKFEDQLPGKPKNVKIDKWLPQNDILAHPNLKLFITHGGLLSTTESVYHGVPVVGIPVFGDQKANMAMAESLGFGKAIGFKDITYDKFLDTVKEVLNNKAYRANARERSKLMRDQPLRPIDNAVFWVEFTLRHKYNKHLRTGGMELEWYQVMLLDVFATIGAAVFIVSFIVYKVCKKLCCSSKQKKYPQEKKKKN